MNNNKKSRSSLKNVAMGDKGTSDAAKSIKRRISFSGKKFIREFDTTEKPREYDNSYEISEHTNGEDSSGHSHGAPTTTTASTTTLLQSTADAFLNNDMDKENTPLASVSTGSVHHDRNDFTLQLQSSINVTLLPHELKKNHLRLMESSGPLDFTLRDSLSLSDIARNRLRENSTYNIPVNEKTIDLVSSKLNFTCLESKSLEKRDPHETILTPSDMSYVTHKEVAKHQTVFFENSNITCDFDDIEPQGINSLSECGISKPSTKENYSFDMGEKDYMNYLPDDSTLSSPLIPLDIISENGINKKLNFRQLNDALDSGRIQLFPNGPKTPTTDRTAKQQRRFWHGLEQDDLPLRETIQPRSTLNFNESMMMSPVVEQPNQKQKHLDHQPNQAVKAKPLGDIKRNYRFSQADEQMLDNTNFLVHAKVGDETQSRNSSKCSSRRETTYDNTAMELDDLEKKEAAVVAAFEKAKGRQTLRLMEVMEEDNYKNNVCNIQEAPVHVEDNQNSRRTMHLNESIEHEYVDQMRPQQCRKTFYMEEPMNISERNLSHIELKSQPPSSVVKMQQSNRRQTLHRVDDIVEESFQDSVKNTQNCRRNMELNDSNEDDYMDQMRTQRSSKSFHTEKAMNITENENPIPLKPLQRHNPGKDVRIMRQQKVVLQSSSEEQNDKIPTPIEADEVNLEPQVQSGNQKSNMRRQTLHMCDSIAEDTYLELESEKYNNNETLNPVKLNSEPLSSVMGLQQKNRRQTLHMADAIVEDSFCSVQQLSSNPSFSLLESKENKRRQTLLLSESIQEDITIPHNEFKSQIFVSSEEQQYSISRTTLPTQEVSNIRDEQLFIKRRQTLHMADPIKADSFCSHGELVSLPTVATSQPHQIKHNKTILISEAIDEDIIDPHGKMEVKALEKANRKQRQTLVMSEPMEEDEPDYKLDNELNSKADPVSTNRLNLRHSIRGAEFIDEDPCSLRLPELKIKKTRQTILKPELIDNDISCIQLKSPTPEKRQKKKNRQTLHMAEAIHEDIPRVSPVKESLIKPRLSESMEIEYSVRQPLSNSKDRLDKPQHVPQTMHVKQAISKAKLCNSSQNMTKCAKLCDDKKIVKATVDINVMETPKMNKSQHLRRNYFPITPGISMIEFEEDEEKCNVKVPSTTAVSCTNATANRILSPTEDMSMDISLCGTPIAASRQTDSHMFKRLPIHLTPNLPQPKKRNMQLPITSDSDSVQEINSPSQDVAAKGRSHIPIPILTKNCHEISPRRSFEQLDRTVQLVRSHAYTPGPLDMNYLMENVKPNPVIFEDNPITISDVSTHFAAQRELAKRSLPNIGRQSKDTTIESRSSNGENNKVNHKKFINLSGDSEILAAAEITDQEEDEIEKIRQSLVSTLTDEEEDEFLQDNQVMNEADNEVESDICLEQLNPTSVTESNDVCKKCKNCKRSIDRRSSSTLDSFVVTDWHELNLGLERLQRMRQRPRIEDLERNWELKLIELDLNSVDETVKDINETESDNDRIKPLTLSHMLDMFNQKCAEYKDMLPKPKKEEPFIQRLETLLHADCPNWRFDYQLQCDCTYIFTHRKITTFRLVVKYEPVNFIESEIHVLHIKADTVKTIPKEQWTVYEHLMDFQLRLRLPLNLIDLLDGNDVESFLKFLEYINSLCMETGKFCNDMHLALISVEARLLREPQRNVVRKTIRKMYQMEDELYSRVEKTNFLIEIGNALEISFKNILQPPLYLFDEKIQFLPKGIAFLEAFLSNPEQYLKMSN